VTRQLRRDSSGTAGLALQVRSNSYYVVDMTPQLRRCNADGETL